MATSAFAITTIGRGRLVGNANLRADYDSNIFVNNSNTDDIVTTLSSEVRYLRDVGVFSLDTGVGATALLFADNTDQKALDPIFDAKVGFTPSSKTDVRGGVRYRRSSIANEIVNDRTESNDLFLDGSAEHLTTEKIGFRVTGGYSESNYRTVGYSDVFNYSAGLFVVNQYSPKLKLLAGVTTLEWWTSDIAFGQQSVSTNDLRYTLGAEGEIAPKVTGDVQVGYLTREFDSVGLSDTDALYVSVSTNWMASEKRSFSLRLSEDLSLTAAGQSLKSSSALVSMNQTISAKLNFDVSAGLDRSSYSVPGGIGSRKDNGMTFRGRIAYTFTDYASIDLSSGYRINNSDLAVSDYDRFNIGVGISLRF